PPHSITTADNQTFYAIGVGDLQVDIPNGDITTPVILHDTLYAPDIAHTTISRPVLRPSTSCESQAKCHPISKFKRSHNVLPLPSPFPTMANRYPDGPTVAPFNTPTTFCIDQHTYQNHSLFPNSPHQSIRQVHGCVAFTRPRDLSRLRGSVGVLSPEDFRGKRNKSDHPIHPKSD
ncbi:hypothetical protein EI94DRAFT_1607907, partial [Lactarius quietus]